MPIFITLILLQVGIAALVMGALDGNIAVVTAGIVCTAVAFTIVIAYTNSEDAMQHRIIQNEVQIKALEKHNERLLRKIEAKEVTQ